MRRKESSEPKKGPLERLSDAFELPAILSSDSAHIELMGNKEAIVNGVRGIILYEEDTVRLSVGKKEIKFCGEGLELKAFSTSSVIVEGEIYSVEFL